MTYKVGLRTASLSRLSHYTMAKTITLHTFQTPNGYKASVFLELLGLEYNVKTIDISKNEQKSESFIAINPNGRIPTLVDHSTGVTISETGAILLYLAETYDKEHKLSYAYGSKEYWLQLEAIMFQMAGQGPMQGQAGHFSFFAPEKIPYGIKRYTDETKRLYSVLELYLERNTNGPYVVGNHLSVADVALFTWTIFAHRLGISLKEYPRVFEWAKNIFAIPEVKKGLSIPAPSSLIDPELTLK